MRDAKAFVDTIVIVYAYDRTAGEKHEKAAAVMKELWEKGNGVVSTQVIQELFVCLTRKIPMPPETAAAVSIIKDLMKWKTVVVDNEMILEAIEIQKQQILSFQDSMIVAAALGSGSGLLLSEDFTDKRKIRGLTIKNPFK